MDDIKDQFGKYRLVHKIADGGMASIYLATSIGPGGFEKPCAIKRIRPEYSASSEFRDMLVREAKVAALLNHPNIVQVFDFGEVDGEYFLTMEWVDGAPLNRILRQASSHGQPLGLGPVLALASNLARAVEYLASGVIVDGMPTLLVHRDISPSNVLISTTGAIKLTDFGIVKVLEAPQGTAAGVIKGKYAYMSPEQLKGEKLDSRSDVFSLGVVLYEVLTRKRLFRRDDVASTIAAVLGGSVPPPSTLADDIPRALDDLVLAMLAKRPADRPSATALRSTVEELAQRAGTHTSGAERLAALARGEQVKEDDDTHLSPTATGLLGDVPLIPMNYGSSPSAMPDVSSIYHSPGTADLQGESGGSSVWWGLSIILFAIISTLGFWAFVLR